MGIASVRPVERWAAAAGVSCFTVPTINDVAAVTAVRAVAPDITVYAGGGILKEEVLRVAGVVLNHHLGPLPRVRGNDPLEWSLLLGDDIVVTVHRIDSGIDTGPVVERISVTVEPGDDLERLRTRCAAVGVEGLRRAVLTGGRPMDRQPSDPIGRQCFTVAEVLEDLVAQRLLARTPAQDR
jgi:methionyl-tRNA formyltransferase